LVIFCAAWSYCQFLLSAAHEWIPFKFVLIQRRPVLSTQEHLWHMMKIAFWRGYRSAPKISPWVPHHPKVHPDLNYWPIFWIRSGKIYLQCLAIAYVDSMLGKVSIHCGEEILFKCFLQCPQNKPVNGAPQSSPWPQLLANFWCLAIEYVESNLLDNASVHCSEGILFEGVYISLPQNKPWAPHHPKVPPDEVAKSTYGAWQ
jgi:hypothetical protein